MYVIVSLILYFLMNLSPLSAECVADIAMVVDSSGSIRDANVAGRKDNYDFVKEVCKLRWLLILECRRKLLLSSFPLKTD